MARVLIIDDDRAIRALFEAFLKQDGHEVHHAVDGQEGVEKARALRPDLLLVDLHMPRLDGLGVCRAVRGDPLLKTRPIVVLSASNETETLAAVLDAGADEFVTKPVSGLELRARARTMLRIYDQQRRLEDLLSHRQRLAHMIVHDLKSPLAAISQLAVLIRDDQALPEETRGDADGIREASERLMALAQDLLLVAKSEAGRLVVSRSRARLDELARQAMRAHTPVAERAGITMTLTSGDGGDVELDRELVMRVLDNLLSNALKFSPSGGKVELRVARAEDDPRFVALCVADEGPGVPIAHRDAIFDEFRTVEMRDLGIPQTGLGLTFCRMVARAHGGTIEVKDNHPKGSVFELRLPA